MRYNIINTPPYIRNGKRSRVGALLRSRVAGGVTCWLCSALLSLMTLSCTRDFVETNPFESGENAEIAGYATLQLLVPGAKTPGTYAADITDETEIVDGSLYAIIYSCNEEDNWQFRRVEKPEITAKETSESGEYQVYNIRIPFYEGDMGMTFRLGLISGITEASLRAAGGYDSEAGRWSIFEGCVFEEDGSQAENPLANACSQIVFTTDGKWPVEPTANFLPFPMWGESEAFTMRPQGTIVEKIYLIRAVARIDVGVNFLKTADGHYPLNDMQSQGLYDGGRGTYFQLESVFIYRTAKSGTYGASADAYDDLGRVVRPTEANGGTFDNEYPLVYTYGAQEITSCLLPENSWTPEIEEAEANSRRCLTRQCYVPETANKGAEFEEAACLVIGGRFGSKNAKATFYRIDFAEARFENGNQLKPTPESRIDLLRNNVYVVNITSVTDAGEDTPEEALKTDNTKLTAEVVAWDQGLQVGDIVTDGVYMLSVDKSEVQYYADGTPETFTVKTSYDGELGKGWTLSVEDIEGVEGVAAKAVVYYDAEGNAIPVGDPRFPTTGLPGTTELRFGMTEFYNDTEVQTRSAILVFTAGRMQTRVMLNQTSRELLRLQINPEELYFGSEGPEKTVTITVTTRKDYKLTVKGTDALGEPYEQQIHPVVEGNPDDRFKTFFVKKSQNDNDNEIVYRLEPTHVEKDWDITFEIIAERTGIDVDPSDPQMQVSETFMVTQLKEPVEWNVVSVNDMPTNVLKTEKSYEVIVPNTATSVIPRIMTTPATLIWWFSKGTSSSATDTWITNLAERIGVQMDLQNTFPAGDIPFSLQANPGLARRSVTLNVETNTPGLDPSTARLIITQKGAPLTLKPSVVKTSAVGYEFTGPTVDPTTGESYYELHHGYDLAGGTYTLGMTANTNWYWYWDTDDQQLHDTNVEMLAPDWQLLNPGPMSDNEVTTDGPNGEMSKTWNEVASFTVPGLETFNVPDGWKPGTQENSNIPLGGTRTVVRELRNSNPQLTLADVEDNAKQLRITRSLPAFSYIAKWPFLEDTGNDANTDRSKDQYTSLDAFFYYDPDTNPNGYNFGAEPFKVLSNAPVELSIMAGSSPEVQDVPVANVMWGPKKGEGYKQMSWAFTKLFEHGVNANSWAEDARFYKFSATIEQQSEAGGENEKKTYSRIYFRGQQIVLPLRNMETGQRLLSSDNHWLKLDFSNSFFRRMKVRVSKQLVNTDGGTSGVETYISQVKNNDASVKKIQLMPLEQQNGTWADGIELLSTGNKLLTFQLGENNEENMMYRVVVETLTSDDWEVLQELDIYQDAKPISNTGYVVYYQQHEWNGTLARGPLSPLSNQYNLYDYAISNETTVNKPLGGGSLSWQLGTTYTVRGAAQHTRMQVMTALQADLPNKYNIGIVEPGVSVVNSYQGDLSFERSFCIDISYYRMWRIVGANPVGIWRNIANIQHSDLLTTKTYRYNVWDNGGVIYTNYGNTGLKTHSSWGDVASSPRYFKVGVPNAYGLKEGFDWGAVLGTITPCCDPYLLKKNEVVINKGSGTTYYSDFTLNYEANKPTGYKQWLIVIPKNTNISGTALIRPVSTAGTTRNDVMKEQ